ncbi:MAG: tail fiber protein [Magnetococcales bacterium]|nr:tail fiber protein [Magnetococcales bacterium]
MDAFIGEIRMFPYTFNPEGWLYCNGNPVLITQYPALYTVIGITFGGDGKTTFNLPKFAGLAPIGAGATVRYTRVLTGTTLGAETAALNNTNTPTHDHTLNAATVVGTSTSPGNTYLLAGRGTAPNTIQTYTPNVSGLPLTNFSSQMVGVAGVGTPHENRQPYLPVPFFICYNGNYPPPPD